MGPRVQIWKPESTPNGPLAKESALGGRTVGAFIRPEGEGSQSRVPTKGQRFAGQDAPEQECPAHETRRTAPALSQCACAGPLARPPRSPPSSVINPCRPSSGSCASPPRQTTAALGSRDRHTHLHLASSHSNSLSQALRSSPRMRGTAPSGIRSAPRNELGGAKEEVKTGVCAWSSGTRVKPESV